MGFTVVGWSRSPKTIEGIETFASDELDTFLARHAVPLWGADADGTPLEQVRAPDRLALMVGNEGAGLSSEGRARVAQYVSIPIRPVVESLNVAVATGIILQQLRS